jgi:TrmH family RNA methyltransferase
MKKCIVTTSLETETYYYEADLRKDIALVIGNEGQGVSDEFLKSAHLKIKIPMAGSIESLNAAVAAGILMYQSQKIK